MSHEIRGLINEKMDKVRMESELAIASTVQHTLIPPSEFKNDYIHIHSLYESASECGGDWWGFFDVGDKVAFMVADATGHGLPSALITAAAHSCFSVIHKQAEEDPDFVLSPARLLTYANRAVYGAANGKIMMTFFCGVFDRGKKLFTFANAGHNPPWLFRKQGTKFVLKSLVLAGTRLGEKKDNEGYKEQAIAVEPKDQLVLYTDGFPEGTNPAGEMYGKKRFKKSVEKGLASGPTGVVSGLVSDFRTFTGNKPFDDDITVAVVEFFPTENIGPSA